MSEETMCGLIVDGRKHEARERLSLLKNNKLCELKENIVREEHYQKLKKANNNDEKMEKEIKEVNEKIDRFLKQKEEEKTKETINEIEERSRLNEYRGSNTEYRGKHYYQTGYNRWERSQPRFGYRENYRNSYYPIRRYQAPRWRNNFYYEQERWAKSEEEGRKPTVKKGNKPCETCKRSNHETKDCFYNKTKN